MKAIKRRGFVPVVTWALIILNVAAAAAFFAAGFFKETDCSKTICNDLALTPSYIMHGEKLWTIFTTMFVHAGAFHLFVNMLSLFFLGSFLERIIGKKRFIMIYLISGILASLFFVGFAALFHQDLSMPAVGASGAIFGLGGILAVLTPRIPVYIMFIPIAMPLWLGIGVMLAAMWAISALAGVPIGNTAHLGGLIAGLAYGFYLRLRYKRKMRVLDRMFR